MSSKTAPLFNTSPESSRYSRTTSTSDALSDVIPENLSFEDLNNVVEGLQQTNRQLELENLIFEDYLELNSPDLLDGMHDVLDAMTEAIRKVEEFALVEAVGQTRGSSGEPAGLENTSEQHVVTSIGAPAEQTSVMSSKKTSEMATKTPSGTAPKKPLETVTENPPEVGNFAGLTSKEGSRAIVDWSSDGQHGRYQIPSDIAKKIGVSSSISIPRPSVISGSQAFTQRTSVFIRRRIALMFERCPRMSYTQRLDIATWAKEKEEKRLQETMKKERGAGGLLRAKIESLGLRLTEIRNLMFRLNASYGNSHFIMPEKFIRDIRETVMYGDSVIESIRLKSSTMRRHRKRILAEFAVKKALSESLRPVDIENVKIENEQLLRAIDLKTMHLHELKSVSGHATQKVNTNKKRLLELTRTLDCIRKDTLKKKKHICQMEQEEKLVDAQARKAERALNQVRERMVKFTAPDVFEYVLQKRDLRNLRKDLNTRKRMINLQTATSLQLQSQLRLRSRDSTSEGRRKSDVSGKKSTDPMMAPFLSVPLMKPQRRSHAPEKNLVTLCIPKPSVTAVNGCDT